MGFLGYSNAVGLSNLLNGIPAKYMQWSILADWLGNRCRIQDFLTLHNFWDIALKQTQQWSVYWGYTKCKLFRIASTVINILYISMLFIHEHDCTSQYAHQHNEWYALFSQLDPGRPASKVETRTMMQLSKWNSMRSVMIQHERHQCNKPDLSSPWSIGQLYFHHWSCHPTNSTKKSTAGNYLAQMAS